MCIRERLASVDMVEGISNVEQKLDMFLGRAGDGPYLHSPSGITHPSPSGVVALRVRQTRSPLLDSLRPNFSVDSEGGAEQGNWPKPSVTLRNQGSENGLFGLGPLPFGFEASEEFGQPGEGLVRHPTKMLGMKPVNAGIFLLETGRDPP